MSVAILAKLATTFGPKIAESLFDKLSNLSNSSKKLDSVAKLIEAGSTTVNALYEVFGSDFLRSLTDAQKQNIQKSHFTYEAGVDDYLEIVKDSNFEKLDLLRGMRDELNVNLERLSVCEKETLQSKFLGVFNLWMRRYENFLPLNDDAKETFAVIEKLLDGQKRNFLEVLKMLQKTGLGLAGAGFVLYAVMIATSTGVGIAAAFHTWLLGIPFGQVFGLAGLGILAVGLSRITFSNTNAMSATVKLAYKLIERQENLYKNTIDVPNSELS